MTTHSREYPSFPIPAAAAILLEEGRLLLIRRGRAPAQGKWTLPGGVIELGESPEEALTREVREECGLDVVVERLVEVIHHVTQDEKGGIRYHYLILDYQVSRPHRQQGGHARLKAGSDVTDARWVALDELGTYDLTAGLTDVIDKAVAINKEHE